MPRKAFHIGIDIDIHAVSCPGVWLCPKGDVILRVSMLGASAHTKRVEPVFPLLFHESFHFRKTLIGVTSLADLQLEMTKRAVLIQLEQWQLHCCRCVCLASFRCSLSELLYPKPIARRLLAGVDIDLLMEPTSCFPGIIAPKVEVSTRVVVEEMINYPIQETCEVNRKTLSSKRLPKKGEVKCNAKNKVSARTRTRQKPVCHAKPNVICYHCKERVEQSKKNQRKVGAKPAIEDDALYIPYCDKCGDVVEEPNFRQGKIMMKTQNDRKQDYDCTCVESQLPATPCDCTLCQKYNDLFSNVSPPTSPVSKRTQLKDLNSSCVTKDKICSCVCKKANNERLRAGVHQAECLCSLNRHISQDLFDCFQEKQNDNVQTKNSMNEDYCKMLQADIESHYRKLYERVCRRSNQF